jgi:beta-xylosidase
MCIPVATLEHWDGPQEAFRPTTEFAGATCFWAPEVHPLNGRFYMFASIGTDKARGTYVLAADAPQGPFVPLSAEPVTPRDWLSIDGTLWVDEANQPWCVFVHEYWQIRDGSMCAVRLSPDLSRAVEEPVTLFYASAAPWQGELSEQQRNEENFVTDGPFLHRTQSGALLMLWSSYVRGCYVLGTLRSDSGTVLGPWSHDEEIPVQRRRRARHALSHLRGPAHAVAAHTKAAGARSARFSSHCAKRVTGWWLLVSRTVQTSGLCHSIREGDSAAPPHRMAVVCGVI